MSQPPRSPTIAAGPVWPSLDFAEWRDTRATLHMWMQIVGKIRLARTPAINHTWQVPLYVSARGLTTSPIHVGTRTFEILFDFVDHELHVETDAAERRSLPLAPRPVADFYRELMSALDDLGLTTRIWPMPVEIPDPIPFDRDQLHRSYDREQASRFWRALLQVDRVLKTFRAGFVGKVSPVHFFWGAFDLAVTRFSGRPAPPHPGGAPNVGDWVMRDAYSHEVSSCGFWPGGDAFPHAVFYAYAYPEPDGFAQAPVRPREAFYSPELREFVLRYEDARRADDPETALLAFCESTYEAAADRGGWDRAALEWRGPGRPLRKSD